MDDYKELVSVLRSEADGFLMADTPDFLMADSLNDAADAIEKLVSNADKFKWISVEERLPEESANYLTYGVFLPLCVKAMDLCRFNGKGWMIDQNVKITHWMPLPEPPKEEEHDE